MMEQPLIAVHNEKSFLSRFLHVFPLLLFALFIALVLHKQAEEVSVGTALHNSLNSEPRAVRAPLFGKFPFNFRLPGRRKPSVRDRAAQFQERRNPLPPELDDTDKRSPTLKKLLLCFYQDQPGTREQYLQDHCRLLTVLLEGREDISVQTYEYPAGFRRIMETGFPMTTHDRFIIFLAVHGLPASNEIDNIASIPDQKSALDTHLGTITYDEAFTRINSFRKAVSTSCPIAVVTNACFGQYLTTSTLYAQDPFPIITAFGFISGLARSPVLGSTADRPKRDDFETDDEFSQALNQWDSDHVELFTVGWAPILDVLTREVSFDLDSIATITQDVAKIESLKLRILKMVSGVKLRSLIWSPHMVETETQDGSPATYNWIFVSAPPQGSSEPPYAFTDFDFDPSYLTITWLHEIGWKDLNSKEPCSAGIFRKLHADIQMSSLPDAFLRRTAGSLYFTNTNRQYQNAVPIVAQFKPQYGGIGYWLIQFEKGLQQCETATNALIRVRFPLVAFLGASLQSIRMRVLDWKKERGDTGTVLKFIQKAKKLRVDIANVRPEAHSDVEASRVAERIRQERHMEALKGFGDPLQGGPLIGLHREVPIDLVRVGGVWGQPEAYGRVFPREWWPIKRGYRIVYKDEDRYGNKFVEPNQIINEANLLGQPLRDIRFKQQVQLFNGDYGIVMGYCKKNMEYDIEIVGGDIVSVHFSQIIHPTNLLDSPLDLKFGEEVTGFSSIRFRVLSYDHDHKNYVVEISSEPGNVGALSELRIVSTNGDKIPPRILDDATEEFSGSIDEASRYFLDESVPIRVFRIRSSQDGQWYCNSVAHPQIFEPEGQRESLYDDF